MFELTDADIAALREVADSARPDVCTISGVTKTQKPSGGWTDVVTVKAAGVGCRVDRNLRQAEERAAGGEIRNIKTRDIDLPWNQDVTDTDIITVTSMNGIACNKVFQVLDAGDVSYGVTRTVQCKQIS